jgi:cation transport regulator ChaB
MESFVQLCENTRKKLGRQLQDNEKAFLQWMYENYKDEEEKKVQGVTSQ